MGQSGKENAQYHTVFLGTIRHPRDAAYGWEKGTENTDAALLS